MRSLLAISLMTLATASPAAITRHAGSGEALPDRKYVHVVSEADSPVMQTWIKAKDGLYVAAAVRKPKGNGPFPAIVMFHGAPGGRGMDQLVGWSRGDHGGPVWERFLQEGYVVVVADYRGGDWNQVNKHLATGRVPAVDRSGHGHRPRHHGGRLRADPAVREARRGQRLRRGPWRQSRDVPGFARTHAAFGGGGCAGAHLVPRREAQPRRIAARFRQDA